MGGLKGFHMEDDGRTVTTRMVGFVLETIENFYIQVKNQQGHSLECTITLTGAGVLDGTYQAKHGLLALYVQAAATITVSIKVAATGYSSQNKSVNHPGVNGQLTEVFTLAAIGGRAYKINKRIYI